MTHLRGYPNAKIPTPTTRRQGNTLKPRNKRYLLLLFRVVMLAFVLLYFGTSLSRSPKPATFG